jgi:hypothetical protein
MPPVDTFVMLFAARAFFSQFQFLNFCFSLFFVNYLYSGTADENTNFDVLLNKVVLSAFSFK